MLTPIRALFSCITLSGQNGVICTTEDSIPTGPCITELAPKTTSFPVGARHRQPFLIEAPPTASRITCTPRPPVIRFTSASKLAWVASSRCQRTTLCGNSAGIALMSGTVIRASRANRAISRIAAPWSGMCSSTSEHTTDMKCRSGAAVAAHRAALARRPACAYFPRRSRRTAPAPTHVAQPSAQSTNATVHSRGQYQSRTRCVPLETSSPRKR